MIGPSGVVPVLVMTEPLDFRKGAEGLAALVREESRADPFGGVIFIFWGKRPIGSDLIFWRARAFASTPSGWRAASSIGSGTRTARSDSPPSSLGRCWSAWTGAASIGPNAREHPWRRGERTAATG